MLDDLDGFTSTGVPDEWVGLVVPGQFQSRYYTVRSLEDGELTLDVVVHDVGLVTEWAMRDCIGDTCPDSSGDDIDAANRYGLFSAIALGVGVAGVGTATYLLLTGGSDEKKEPKVPTTQIGLAATPQGAAGSVRVRF